MLQDVLSTASPAIIIPFCFKITSILVQKIMLLSPLPLCNRNEIHSEGGKELEQLHRKLWVSHSRRYTNLTGHALRNFI